MKRIIAFILIVSVVSVGLVGCGGGDANSTSSTSSRNSVSSQLQESTSASSPQSKNASEVPATATLSTFNVDWEKCIANTKENSLMITANYPYVKDVYIDVDDDKKEIVFMAILDDSTNPKLALDYADAMIRQFNMWARMQDESISSSTKNSYGGLYDVYSIRIGIAPLSQSQNQSKWFVSDYINRGLHTKHTIELEKAYR